MSDYVIAYLIGIIVVLGVNIYVLVEPNSKITRDQQCYINIVASLFIMYYFTQKKNK
jgi:hypothetical protein